MTRPQRNLAASGFVAALATMLAGCAAMAPVAPPVTAAMQSHSASPPGALKSGRELFVYRCTSCHTLDPARSHPLPFWREQVGEMAARSKLTPPEQSAILAYLTAVHETPAE